MKKSQTESGETIINVHLDPATMRRLEKMAEASKRTLSEQLQFLLTGVITPSAPSKGVITPAED